MAHLRIDRRHFLRGTGVSLALPMLESLTPTAPAGELSAEDSAPAKRFVCVAPDYGIYPPGFFPEQTGRGYAMPDTLKMMERHRDEMSVFSYLDHPGVGGGHACTRTFLNGMKASDAEGDRSRLLSLDQVIARQIGMDQRFPALVTGNGAPISYTCLLYTSPSPRDCQ